MLLVTGLFLFVPAPQAKAGVVATTAAVASASVGFIPGAVGYGILAFTGFVAAGITFGGGVPPSQA